MPFGDIVLARLPFSDGQGHKMRPILVVCEFDDADILVVPVTSQPVRDDFDTLLRDWQAAGLRLPSTARTCKLATLARTMAVKVLGELTPRDRESVQLSLHRVWASILDRR